jgi:hypothetical protein
MSDDPVSTAVAFIRSAASGEGADFEIAIKALPAMADRLARSVGHPDGFEALIESGPIKVRAAAAAFAERARVASSSSDDPTTRMLTGPYACLALISASAAGNLVRGSREDRGAELAATLYGRALGLRDALKPATS